MRQRNDPKNALTPTALEILKAKIWRMPLLSLSIVEHDRKNWVAACLGLVEHAARLAPHLSVDQRYRVAERMRSAADKLEIAPAYTDEVVSRTRLFARLLFSRILKMGTMVSSAIQKQLMLMMIWSATEHLALGSSITTRTTQLF